MTVQIRQGIDNREKVVLIQCQIVKSSLFSAQAHTQKERGFLLNNGPPVLLNFGRGASSPDKPKYKTTICAVKRQINLLLTFIWKTLIFNLHFQLWYFECLFSIVAQSLGAGLGIKNSGISVTS